SEHRQPNYLSTPTASAKFLRLQQFMDGDEVADGLRHLLTLHLEEAVMQPIVGHDRCVEGAARLGDLVLMMRKDEVDAAAMDVESLAEMLPRHGRAFDVPAWTPRRGDAGWRGP